MDSEESGDLIVTTGGREMSLVQLICMGLALSRLSASSGKLCVEGKEGDLHMLRARHCQAFCMKCQKLNNLDFMYGLCCNDSVLLS